MLFSPAFSINTPRLNNFNYIKSTNCECRGIKDCLLDKSIYHGYYNICFLVKNPSVSFAAFFI